jgi:7,8-dihydroneopterin aldolase/epimerase/oxygenase
VDRISIRDLRVPTRIGVTSSERAEPQVVVITVDLYRNLEGPGESDDLGDTIDYHAVTVAIADMVRTSEAKLLEHLAERIAALVIKTADLERAIVEVRKEPPPMEEDVRSVAVTIERP